MRCKVRFVILRYTTASLLGGFKSVHSYFFISVRGVLFSICGMILFEPDGWRLLEILLLEYRLHSFIVFHSHPLKRQIDILLGDVFPFFYYLQSRFTFILFEHDDMG